jgi:regulator of protease activity HflC (stomatin/prohibitin superfamily)
MRYNNNMNDQETKQIVKLITRIALGLFVFLFIWGSFTLIPPGKRGVVKRLYAINRVIGEGPNLKIPIFERVVKMDVQTQKEQVDASAASKDLQNVAATVALNYNLQYDKVGELYRLVGMEYKERIIDPAIQESVKAATAKYTAEELITKREEVRDIIKTSIKERLAREFMDVTEVSIVNFNFSQSFNTAIEAKVTAEQNALAAKNKLEQVKFEAEQRVSQAKGEAEAIKIQAQAITQQGGAEYVKLQWIKAWSEGGSSVPTTILGEGSGNFILDLNR